MTRWLLRLFGICPHDDTYRDTLPDGTRIFRCHRCGKYVEQIAGERMKFKAAHELLKAQPGQKPKSNVEPIRRRAK